ncbi:hypothetical protein ACMD2_14908 [Ananas comosus]|uniref:Uncharacterized protein n=1 Tax=Ananas comosus TaxID=4615 RepID=A0A199VYW4_ANACO|nr:hypothetical protein ACMD2_14908 [Ananas comosus]
MPKKQNGVSPTENKKFTTIIVLPSAEIGEARVARNSKAFKLSPISGLAGARLLRLASGGTPRCAQARDGCGGGEEHDAHLGWQRRVAAATAERAEPAQARARSSGSSQRRRWPGQVAAARRRGRTETSARARAGAAAAGRGGGSGPQGRRRPAGRAAETAGTAAGAGSCGGCVRGGRGLDSAWARAGKLQDAAAARAAAAALWAARGGGDRRRGTPRGRGDVDKVP